MKKSIQNFLKRLLKFFGVNFFTVKGRYRIFKTCNVTGDVLSVTDWIPNLVVNGTGTGVNIIARLLGNDSTYPLAITKCKIGTGTTAPTNADTDIEAGGVTKNSVADQVVSGGVVTLSFFYTSAELPNNTYTEFAIFCVDQLFARSIISPSYIKGTNEDTTCEYEITVSNT